VPTILYAGRLSREKNLDLLIDSFRALLSSGRRARLLLVGDGPDRKRLESLARGPEVGFTGFLHGTELARAYASADLFAFPSTTDTFGNAVLEAHASGLPAVVTTRGGPAEIVRRRDSGLVTDPNRSSFAAALAALCDEPGLRARLAGEALTTAREASWARLVARLWNEEPEEPAVTSERTGGRTAKAVSEPGFDPARELDREVA
jgi:glycosyltransferase involved in cell wall biosynthesis